MFYNFATCYNTVSNMRRYGHKCQIKILIFYSTFSLSSQYLIQHFLSLLTDLSLSNPCSLSFFFRSPSLILKSTVRRPHRSSHRSKIKLPPSPIKPPPSLLVWRLHHRRSENAIVTGLKPPLPPRSEVAMPPRSEPISTMAWSCSTSRLMRISATTRSRS